MKKLINIIGLIAIMVACNPDRVDVLPTQPTELEFFTNLNDFRQAIYGAYSEVYDLYSPDHPSINQSRGLAGLWYLPGDDLTETQGARLEFEIFTSSLNPNFNRIRAFWRTSYEMIQRANVVVEKVNTVDFSGFEGRDEIAIIGGEALVLRAYSYYNLFTNFGGVPLIIERIVSQDAVNPPRATAQEVIDQVITDLTAAEDVLPETWDDINQGRITKNSARSLLVKALVTRANYFGSDGDYAAALTVFGRISNVLLPDYTDNFDAFDENNAESALEWQASGPTAGRGGNFSLHNSGPWRGVELLEFFRGHSMSGRDPNSPGNGAEASWQSQTKYIITNKLRDLAGNDPRVAFWLAPINEGVILEKYTKPGFNVQSARHEGSRNNERVLRYGDLKLFAAEAALKSGSPSVAIGHINDVRARANAWGATLVDADLNPGLGITAADLVLPEPRNTGESNATTIMDWIMEERFVELAGEGHRWNDLKRWHFAGDMDLTGWGVGDTQFSVFPGIAGAGFGFDVNTHLLFPLPQAEVERNSSINENNPGYN